MSKDSKQRNNRSTNVPELTDSQTTYADDTLIDRIEPMFVRLTKLMTDSFNACVVQLVSTIDAKLTQSVEVHSSEIFILNTRIDQLEKKVEELATSNKALACQLQDATKERAMLTQAIDNLEQYSRADSLLIHGISLPPPGGSEDLYTDVPVTLNRLIPSTHLSPDMISVVHRLPTQQPTAASGSSSTAPRPPPIVVKFVRRQIRSELMSNRRLLKGKNVVLSDHLTPTRAALLKRANSLVNDGKLAAAWSQDGKILCKSLANCTVLISTASDLGQFT